MKLFNKKENVIVDSSIAHRETHKASASRRKKAGDIATYTGLIIISLIWIIPFLLLIFASFGVDSSGTKGTGPQGIFPTYWGFASYVVLFTDPTVPFLKWFGNTFLMALATAFLSSSMTIMMAYVLSRFRFKGRKFLMNSMLILGMFPGFLSTIVLYYVLKSLGLTQGGAIGGLILVYFASSGMGYYISKGYFDTIPKSLDEAAQIDGATKFQVFYKIMLPLAKPIIIYTVLTAFMAPWGDFIFARYITFGYSDSYNVAVGLWNLLSKDKISNYYTVFCAGGVLVSIPVTALFIALERYYVAGVTGGAVKG